MKFGKYIQKRQLEIPEYAASFVDYKALKRLIKSLSKTPVLSAQSHEKSAEPVDPRTSLEANKATFFFRLEREIEKVNKFYLQKEAELKLRLSTLLGQKKSMQALHPPASRVSSRYIALEDGFRQFSGDLTKLQQFIEINQTAFSKILKKWDKTSKQDTKVRYLMRAVEPQPCFNRDVISNLSDEATSNLLDFAAWGEGERMQYTMSNGHEEKDDAPRSLAQDDADLDSQIYDAIAAGNLDVLQDWASRIRDVPDAEQRITQAFLGAAEDAPDAALQLLLKTEKVDLQEIDEINHRNILHRAAISGREVLLRIGLQGNVNVKAVDVYGRIPLHYACMHGSEKMVQGLLNAGPDTVDLQDHDKFTPLIHAIVHSHLPIVKLLAERARIDPASESDHIPLNLACKYGSIPIVEELLKRNPKILPDAEGLYPQHLVARSSKAPQLLLRLRDYGVALDQVDELYQWTPLFHAASEGNIECLQTLLACGVDPQILDEKGLSSLYYATWEGHLACMQLLASTIQDPKMEEREGYRPSLHPSATPGPKTKESDTIPPFNLPPPIIPIRRYGHNYLESKTFVIINFGHLGYDAIQFYDDNKYPAARLTISSKSSDLIPRNLPLPIQDDYQVSFQIDNLDTFAIDFDVYPTFGARVIARTVASSKVFTDRSSSSGVWHLELLDPRLRAIGRISFSFQVIKPFSGVPLEITHFATYWKETDDEKPHNSNLVTGSSLSGDYVRLFVQMTSDGVPVLFPQWKIQVYEGLDVPLNSLTYAQFATIGARRRVQPGVDGLQTILSDSLDLERARLEDPINLPHLHRIFAGSFATLADTLSILPNDVHVELHVLFPCQEEEEQLRLGPTPNINDFADGLLKVVFDHARAMRDYGDAAHGGFLRSVVFSSFNPDICIALNWKQPNYPVLLCDEIGAGYAMSSVQSSGRTTLSIKEAVRVATDNNFMGLICSSRLLNLAPALIDSIKGASLVLISDVSSSKTTSPRRIGGPASSRVPVGVDGTVKADGTLHFNDSVDL